MTNKSPAPIDSAKVEDTGEPIDMALLAEQQAAFEKWWPEWRHLCPDRASACVAFVAGMDAAPTPSRVPVASEVTDHCWTMYQQGQISADHTAKEVFAEVLQSFADWLTARDAEPLANFASTLLTDEQIYEMAFKYCYAMTAANGFVFDRERGHMIAFARALLQANGATK